MKGTQGVEELGQNLSLGPQTNHERIDKSQPRITPERQAQGCR
jgi:hypothetical protein